MTHYVALDLETTGLDVHQAHPLEIAAVEALPDDPGVYGLMTAFVPHTDRSVINDADPDALAVNRWYERRLYQHMASPAATLEAIDHLVTMLDGAVLVGANPAYDAAILWRWLRPRTALLTPPWRFRLYDVEVATAAALGLEHVPSLAECVDLWAIDAITATAHTAAGDAFAAADVFAAVFNHHRPADAVDLDAR